MYVEDTLRLAMLFCRTPMALVAIRESEMNLLFHRGLKKEPEAFPVSLIPVTDLITVADTLSDPGFAAPRLRSIDPEIRSFAAAPLYGKGERSLGAICVMDLAPRRLDPDQLEALSLLGRQARCCIEFQKKRDDYNRLLADLRDSESRYRNLTENILDGFFQSTLEGKLIAANPALMRLFGFDSLDELLAMDLETICADSVTPNRLTHVLECEGELRCLATTLKRKDGTKMRGTIRGHVVRDNRGYPLYFEGMITDVSTHLDGNGENT